MLFSGLIVILIFYLLIDDNYTKIIVYDKDIKSESIRYVFFDLGLNNGDSMLNFLGLNSNAQGGTLTKLVDSKLMTNKSWILYGFEPNNFFDNELYKIKSYVDKDRTNHKLYLYNGTAAWIYDGKITFYLDTNNGNKVGSSLKENHRDVVNNKSRVDVPCVDIARLLRLYDEKDIIVMKIDIEGAEYELLMHLINQNVMKLIDYIAVEYHGFVRPYQSPEELLNGFIKMNNIKLLEWI